jgi:DNA helicase-2/ATP-dependent DNA helicase PcrA
LNRYVYGYSEPAELSRFLSDIPLDVLDSDMSMRSTKTRGYFPEKWESKGETPAASRAFDPGMKVGHGIWGEGLVLKSELEDDDEIVDVFFESVGLKRVVASIAKLEIKTS